MSSPATVAELRDLFKEREWTVWDTFGKGIHVLTPTGYCISIQWGPGNYCSNRNFEFEPWLGPYPARYTDCSNAEIQIYSPVDGLAIRFEGWTGDVRGWVPVNEILVIVDYLAEVGSPVG